MNTRRESIDWDNAKSQLQMAAAASDGALGAENIERIYRSRASELANRNTAAKGQGAILNVLAFTLAGESYGIPIAALSEVLPGSECTPVPRALPEIAGVINLRGELRSVIDLQVLLSVRGNGAAASGHILMLRNGSALIGLKVGPVDKMLPVREEELVTSESTRSDGSRSYFQGTIPGKVTVLDVAALLSHPVFGSSSS